MASQLSTSAIAAVVAFASLGGWVAPAIAQLPPEPEWRPVDPQPLPSNELPFSLQTTLLRAGDTLGATFVDDDTLYFDPRETRAASLYIRNDVFDASGNVAIPAGTLPDASNTSLRMYSEAARISLGSKYRVSSSTNVAPNASPARSTIAVCSEKGSSLEGRG